MGDWVDGCVRSFSGIRSITVTCIKQARDSSSKMQVGENFGRLSVDLPEINLAHGRWCVRFISGGYAALCLDFQLSGEGYGVALG